MPPDIELRIIEWAGSHQAAEDWYYNHQIPSFGGMTANDLVLAGKIKALHEHLTRIEYGVYT